MNRLWWHEQVKAWRNGHGTPDADPDFVTVDPWQPVLIQRADGDRHAWLVGFRRDPTGGWVMALRYRSATDHTTRTSATPDEFMRISDPAMNAPQPVY